ncbi:alpha/beta hydrolase [Candidatus Saccharibacteria bacterium]|nr:alpha/beta hydrolase [Candidatus Saccharibacteria bacterium]
MTLKLTEEWDKVFPKNDDVEHKKVTFKNHFGIELAADMYTPKDANGKLPAIAVAGPYGAVKEQSSGLYAQEMAKRGFVAIAFDPSYTGESGGEPRYVTSWDLNVEDYQAAVDFLSNCENVDAEKISIIGVCGWGGVALQTACLDTRIKATICSTMYDMPRVARNGYFDSENSAEARQKSKEAINAQRTEDFKNGSLKLAGGVVDPLPEDAPQFLKDYHAYYKTERGYHKRSLNSNDGWAMTGNISLANTTAFTNSNEIKNAVMIVHGEKAHSRYLGEDAFAAMTGFEYKTHNAPEPYAGNAPLGETVVGNKELLIVEGASHVDLYDNFEKIPFDKIEKFIRDNIEA